MRAGALVLAAVLALAGCAGSRDSGSGDPGAGDQTWLPHIDATRGVCPPPAAPGEALVADDPEERSYEDHLQQIIAVDDPIEPFNRGVYAFNYLFDRYIFIPVVDVYKAVVPEVLRDRFHDFFSNINELITFANLVLQARPGPAAQTAFRFGVNSSLGMFGFIDIASAVGMQGYKEDFGQTMGCWGVPPGPYLVLPFLGPSSVRDASGTAVDRVAFTLIDPFGASSYDDAALPILVGFSVINAIDTRSGIPFRYFSSGSPFEYEYIRLLFTRMRRADLSR
jgi:phospholipid-binding lipoprotein MlaA